MNWDTLRSRLTKWILMLVALEPVKKRRSLLRISSAAISAITIFVSNVSKMRIIMKMTWGNTVKALLRSMKAAFSISRSKSFTLLPLKIRHSSPIQCSLILSVWQKQTRGMLKVVQRARKLWCLHRVDLSQVKKAGTHQSSSMIWTEMKRHGKFPALKFSWVLNKKS